MQEDATRALSLALGISLCTAAVALVPLAARSALQIAGRQAQYSGRFVIPSGATSASGDVLAIRDPFVPDPSADVGGDIGAAKPGRVLPIVHAVVVGADSRALVEDNGRMRILQKGDELFGSRIRTITGKGLELANGVNLPLTEPAP